MKKQIPWKFHEIAVKNDPVFFAAIANHELEPACKNIGGIEAKVAEMMTSSKEHNKTNKKFKLENMREIITIEINLRMFTAEVGFEMVDGVVTDINTLFVIIDDLHWNMNYLIEPLKSDIEEDIMNNLIGRGEL